MYCDINEALKKIEKLFGVTESLEIEALVDNNEFFKANYMISYYLSKEIC